MTVDRIDPEGALAREYEVDIVIHEEGTAHGVMATSAADAVRKVRRLQSDVWQEFVSAGIPRVSVRAARKVSDD